MNEFVLRALIVFGGLLVLAAGSTYVTFRDINGRVRERRTAAAANAYPPRLPLRSRRL